MNAYNYIYIHANKELHSEKTIQIHLNVVPSQMAFLPYIIQIIASVPILRTCLSKVYLSTTSIIDIFVPQNGLLVKLVP